GENVDVVLIMVAGDRHRLHRLEEDHAEDRHPEVPDAEEQAELHRQHHRGVGERPAVLRVAQDLHGLNIVRGPEPMIDHLAGGASLGHAAPATHAFSLHRTPTPESVERVQAMNDNLPEATGTAERLRRHATGPSRDTLRGHTHALFVRPGTWDR